MKIFRINTSYDTPVLDHSYICYHVDCINGAFYKVTLINSAFDIVDVYHISRLSYNRVIADDRSDEVLPNDPTYRMIMLMLL